jgi:hypothetical protein
MTLRCHCNVARLRSSSQARSIKMMVLPPRDSRERGAAKKCDRERLKSDGQTGAGSDYDCRSRCAFRGGGYDAIHIPARGTDVAAAQIEEGA